MEQDLMSKAINAAGGVTKLAKSIGVPYQNIQKWVQSGRPPTDKVVSIEEAVNGAVMRHEFFPELFEGYEPVHVDYSRKSSKGSLPDA